MSVNMWDCKHLVVFFSYVYCCIIFVFTEVYYIYRALCICAVGPAVAHMQNCTNFGKDPAIFYIVDKEIGL